MNFARYLFILTVILSMQEASAQDTTYHKTLSNNSFIGYVVDTYRVQTADSLGFKIMEYSKSGELLMEGHSTRRDTLFREGLFRYYKDSLPVSEGCFHNNKRVGEWKDFYSDGKVRVVRNFNNEGKYHGSFKVLYPDGTVRRSDLFNNGKLTEGKCYKASGADTAWFAYETQPEFPGGENKRMEYLVNTVVYPKAAREAGIQGIVYVTFVVERDGTISNEKILRGVHPLLDDETLRVIRGMPRWITGRLDGKPVKVQFNMPLKFTLTR
jgi:TonB family protein